MSLCLGRLRKHYPCYWRIINYLLTYGMAFALFFVCNGVEGEGGRAGNSLWIILSPKGGLISIKSFESCKDCQY